MNIFAKLSTVKQLLNQNLPEQSDAERFELIQGAAKWHYDKRRTLTPAQAMVYEILIKNSYNPYTIYRWFLLAKSPLELREKLKMNLISQREAFAQKRELNSLANTSHQQVLQEIMNTIKRYVVR